MGGLLLSVGNSIFNHLKSTRAAFVCNSLFHTGKEHSWTLNTWNVCNLAF